MQRTDSLEKTLILGKIEGGRGRGRQRMRWLDGITNSMDRILSNSGSWWWTGKPGVLQSMGLQRVGHDWVTELNWYCFLRYYTNAHFIVCVCLLSHSIVSNSANLSIVAHQPPLSMGFSRQEYWSGLTTIIQHSFGSPSYSNPRRKRMKRNPEQKRRRRALTVCRWHDNMYRKP